MFAIKVRQFLNIDKKWANILAPILWWQSNLFDIIPGSSHGGFDDIYNKLFLINIKSGYALLYSIDPILNKMLSSFYSIITDSRTINLTNIDICYE